MGDCNPPQVRAALNAPTTRLAEPRPRQRQMQVKWAIAFSVSLWAMLIAYCADSPEAFIAASLAAAVSLCRLLD